MILLLRRGRLSVPGGATYLGKFSQGKPVGKGRLVDLTRKKEKGKFSSISEVLNRYLCFVIELLKSFFQDVHQGLRCGDNIPRQGGDRRLCLLCHNWLEYTIYYRCNNWHRKTLSCNSCHSFCMGIVLLENIDRGNSL